MIKHTMALALSLTALTLPSTASAVTQVASGGTGLGTAGTTDANWKVNGVNAYIPTTKNTAWKPVNPTGPANQNQIIDGSRWIQPGSATNYAPGTYEYTTVFTLSNMVNMSTLVLTGKFWADNGILSIFLNGSKIYTNPNTNPEQQNFGVAAGTPFGGTTGAVYGVNTLKFELINGGTSPNPSALNATYRVAAAVPEPGTWMLMLLGFAAIGFAMRSRAKTQVRFQFA